MATDFWRTKHVVVTGGAGFFGSAIVRTLHQRSPAAVTVPTRQQVDLRRSDQLQLLFDQVLERTPPADVLVIHAAGRVGGIGTNLRQPATLFYDNLLMGAQLLHEAWRRGIGKLVALGTVCAYPKLAPLPFREEDLWNGYPEETNAAYGLAKKALLVQGQAYRTQYGFKSIFLLPTNLYGPGDHFDPEDSHVVPALIRKCVEARRQQLGSIVAWGSGTATRDYLFVDDAAEGVLLAAEHYDGAERGRSSLRVHRDRPRGRRTPGDPAPARAGAEADRVPGRSAAVGQRSGASPRVPGDARVRRPRGRSEADRADGGRRAGLTRPAGATLLARVAARRIRRSCPAGEIVRREKLAGGRHQPARAIGSGADDGGDRGGA